jgi:hypothetical protein
MDNKVLSHFITTTLAMERYVFAKPMVETATLLMRIPQMLLQ